MQENDSGQQRTEQPTPKRIDKARKDGQVARSRELSTSLLFLFGSLSFFLFGALLSASLQSVMDLNFEFDRASIMDPSLMIAHLYDSFFLITGSAFFILLFFMFAGVIGSISIGGFVVSTTSIKPKLTRLNPFDGLKRMFSSKSFVELIKALFKFIIIVLTTIIILLNIKDDLFSIAIQDIFSAINSSTFFLIFSFFVLSLSTLFIAFIDIPFQLFDHIQKLKMTRQQVKDELKDSEGRPEIKGRVRNLQRDLANSRMLSSIPEADVIIVNPEHFSVALKYESNGHEAPVVLAKGVDHIAIKIREVGSLNKIPILESPLLTRAIYYTTDIDQSIPEKLYLAVAHVLAFIYQLRSVKDSLNYSNTPIRNRTLNGQIKIPNDYKFNTNGELDCKVN
tara:strand:- start:687 stop:1868 length:1182 start_codon:yes stop_codon:yes gene_type:complete